MWYSPLLALYSILLLALLIGGVRGSSEVSCMDAGFNPQVLRCSTCTEHLQPVLGAESIATTKCLQCCIPDVEEKYAMAVLEVDRQMLKYMPDIQAVVKEKKSLGLKVRYAQVSPRLLMYKGENDAEAADTVNVISWNADTFKDYLKAHLVAGEKKKDQQGEKEAPKKDKIKKKKSKAEEL